MDPIIWIVESMSDEGSLPMLLDCGVNLLLCEAPNLNAGTTTRSTTNEVVLLLLCDRAVLVDVEDSTYVNLMCHEIFPFAKLSEIF
jgi:hypothetical protein